MKKNNHMSHQKKQEHHTRPYKIAAQSAGLVICLFILFFIAGKGIPAVLRNDQNELVPFIPFLILPLAGYIVTWMMELAGAVMMTAGGIILIVFFMFKGDASIGLVYGLPFIIGGCLFLLHINKRNHLKKKS